MSNERDAGNAAGNEDVDVKLSWIGFEEKTIVAANQFVSQFDVEDGLFVVSFGMVTQPLLLGSPEEVREQARALDFVPVETLSRVAITAPRLRQLIQVLQGNLEKYESR